MPERSVVKVNGVELSVLDQGTGPLVVLLHGFPEGAYSWRHQIEPLVAAGYRVIAPDQRGYGDSSHPDSIDQYSIMHLVGDIVGLIASAGEKTAAVIGHDWGAMVAWNVAAMRPDIVRGVVGLSVPPVPRGDILPLRQMLADYDGRFYVNYFDRVGPVDDELNRDVPASLRTFFHLLSGDNPINDTARPILIPAGGGVLDGHEDRLPSWLSEAELDNFVRLLTSDHLFLDLSKFPPGGAVINNIVWLLLYTPVVLAVGLIVAVLADKVRYESFIKSVIFLPMAISATAAGIIWLFIYSPDPNIGLLNAVLTKVIPGFQPISWTGDVNLVNPAIIVAAVWINAGFVMVILSAALKGIPTEVLEAARVDGATPLQIFARIQVPLLGPTISVVTVTMIIYVIKMFDLIFVMGGNNGGPLGVARVIAFTQYVETFNNGRAGYGSAVAVIMLLLVIPVMVFNIRRFRAEAGR